MPKVLPFAPHFNCKYQFHDLALSRSVMSARHAVAIDERRVTYPPTLWDNLDQLNALYPERDRPYRQEWFPGDHGSVGGGGDVLGLSSCVAALDRRGRDRGRAVGRAGRGRRRSAISRTISASLSSKSVQRAGALALLNRWAADREGPASVAEVSDCARAALDRRAASAPYRPAALSRVAAALDAIARSPSGGG